MTMMSPWRTDNITGKWNGIKLLYECGTTL